MPVNDPIHSASNVDLADAENLDHLLIWWDLGPRTTPAALEQAQTVVGELVSAATFVFAIESPDSPFYLSDVLLYRGNRIYLRHGPATYVARLQEERTPTVLASGYSNPWWEVLQDVPLAWQVAGGAAGAVGLASGVVAFIDKCLDVVKKAALHGDQIRHDRLVLRAEAAKLKGRGLAVLDASEAVGTIRGNHGDDFRTATRGQVQPSVPDDIDPSDAVVALASDRLLEAMAALSRALRDDTAFDSQLINVTDAAERLDLIQRTQRDMLSLARGDIDTEQFEGRLLDRRDAGPAKSLSNPAKSTGARRRSNGPPKELES